MFNQLCVRMPYLHPALNALSPDEFSAAFTNLKYFWPGQAGLDSDHSYWQADTFPLSPAEASSFLASLHGQDLAELERIRHLMRQRLHEEDRRFRSEMAELQRFVAAPEGKPPESQIPLRQAQMNLLLLWLQEEEFLEIESLAKKCFAAESRLLENVHDAEEAAPGASVTGLRAAAELLPDWKKIFLNAAFFIKAGLPVLLEGAMREELLDRFSFETADVADNKFVLKKISLPLWQILGLSEADRASPLAEYWNRPRLLLALDSCGPASP